MPTVTITVNAKNYQIACDEGQESHVQSLGAYVDESAQTVAGAAGSETYQLVLTSLVLADELFDLRTQLAQAQSAVQSDAANRAAALQAKLDSQRAQMSATANGLAEQLESIAKRLKSA